MKTMKKILTVALCASLTLTGCTASANKNGNTGVDNKNKEASIIQVDTTSFDLEYSKKDTNSAYDETTSTQITFLETPTITGSGANANGNIVTINSAGTYVISGKTTSGQVVVDTGDDEKIQLVLAGLELTCENGPCLNIQNADKVFVILKDGTINTLSDGNNFFVGEEDELDATIFSKSDITFNGAGSLKINATAGHAIHSKDDLIITSGNFDITSTKTGLLGKDCVKIKQASVAITSQTDCIKSNNTEDETKGFVSIDGGTFTLKSSDKGIQASKLIRLFGGDINIESEDDCVHSDSKVSLCGSNLTLSAGDDAVHSNDQLELSAGNIKVTKCYEGLEAFEVTVSGGTTEIHASDDGINAALSNSSSGVEEDSNGDSYTPSTNNGSQAPSSGTQQQPQNGFDPNTSNDKAQQTPPEKPDANEKSDQNEQGEQPPAMPNENMKENNQNQSTPPNAAQPPNAGQTQGGGDVQNNNIDKQMQGGQMQNKGDKNDQTNAPGANQGASIAITGGTLTVYVENGDGLDSNGSVLMTDGILTVVGPSNNGNSSLDFDGIGTITGGTFFAIGSAGMAQNFGSTSTQASVASKVSGNSGDVVSVTDETGNEIVSFTANCNYSYVQASSVKFTEGEKYLIVANGKELANTNATNNQSSRIGT